jgi:hypothetical protein
LAGGTEGSQAKAEAKAKRDEIIGGWRKLHIEKLRDLYSSPNIKTIIT